MTTAVETEENKKHDLFYIIEIKKNHFKLSTGGFAQ